MMMANKGTLVVVVASLVACGGDGERAEGTGGSGGTTVTTGAGAGSSTGAGASGGGTTSSGPGGATTTEGFATDFPGDQGIESHPSVLFHEAFDADDVGSLIAGWDSAGGEGTFSLVDDVPAGAPAGSRSLRMSGDGGSLYQTLPDQQGTVFVRYYAKYDDQSAYHHAGMWLGGFNPPTPWPQGTAGLRPNGSDFFHNAFEPAAGTTLGFDHYAQWPGMDCFQEPGGCWGNVLMRNAEPTVVANAWTCVELMMTMNTPGQADGEYALFLDGQLIQHLAPGAPAFNRLGNGVWEPDPNGEPFPGFDWRSTPDLALNWIWLDFYVDGFSTMSWDQLVVATERIGCMVALD